MKIIPLAIPTPFEIGDVNVYLIKEDPLTLIDVGPKTAEAAAALSENLRKNGVVLSDIERIALTHAHADHCGLAKRTRDEAKNARILIHPWETGHLSGGIVGEARRNLLVRAGVPPEILLEMQSFYEKVSLLTDTLAADEFSELRDEADLEFSSGILKVLHTPGHTPGSCSFFRESNRTLIAGDTVLKRVTPNPVISPDPFDKSKRFNSLAEYLVSLARIRSLAPTLVYGGHGEPVTDYDEIFHRYICEIDARQASIIKLVVEKSLTAWEAAKQLFPKAINQNGQRVLAVSEAAAHLDYAESEGKISVELKNGAEFYKKI